MPILIAGQPYELAEASIFAYVIDPQNTLADSFGVEKSGLFWRLEINLAAGMSFWQDDIRMSNLNRWPDIIGQTVTWNNQINSDTGEMDVGWYGAGLICSNSDILGANLRFVERYDERLHIQWDGAVSTAPLFCEPSPEERLSFSIDCSCLFEGIGVLNAGDATDSSKRELIAQYLDINDFSQHFTDLPKFVPGYLPVLKPL